MKLRWLLFLIGICLILLALTGYIWVCDNLRQNLLKWLVLIGMEFDGLPWPPPPIKPSSRPITSTTAAIVNGQLNCPAYPSASKNHSRLHLLDTNPIDTSCQAIRSRNYSSMIPGSASEAEFPILFVRIVYRDYLFTELLLSGNYQPQNLYCFFVDVKSEAIYKNQMAQLGNCFPNIHLISSNFSITSNGGNMTNAYLDALMRMRKFEWKYAILLQQHDVLIRANWEMVEILRLLNGSSHMGISPGKPWTNRLHANLTWTIGDLELLDNETCQKIYPNCERPVKFAKGMVQMLLARRFVEYIFTTINVTKLVQQLDSSAYTDELFWQTLNYDRILGVPGGFPSRCLDEAEKTRQGIPTRVRYALWGWPNNRKSCATGIWRHFLCIFGVEDVSRLKSVPYILVNKILPYFDAAPAICLTEEIHRRQIAGLAIGSKLFDATIRPEFENLLEVRFMKWIATEGKSEMDFICFP